MSAPKRIIADCGNVQSGTSDLCQWEHWGDLVEYIRADLCTPTDERVKALEAENAQLRELADYHTLTRAQHWLRRHLVAPEDAEVELLCEKHGYGAVMDAASRLWARRPHGQGAFYIGGCIGAWSDDEARAALRDMGVEL